MPKSPVRRRLPNSAVADVIALEQSGDYEQLIAVLRERIADDRRVLTNDRVKQWAGRRWRDIFLTEAALDPTAVKTASTRSPIPGGPALPRRGDTRTDRQKVAERFLARDIEDWQLELPAPREAGRKKQPVVYCPSFVHTAIPLIGFAEEFPSVADEQQLTVIRADTHGFRGAAANVEDVYDAFTRGIGTDAAGLQIERPRKPRDVVMMGYSKGGTDAYVFQGAHLELAPDLRAVINWAGCIGGTPLIDDVYRLIAPLPMTLGPGRAAITALLKTLLPIANLGGLLERTDEWDLKQALIDLTVAERSDFARTHARAIDDTDVPVFNIAGAVSALEVPYFQMQGAMNLARQCGENDMQLSVEHAQSHQPMSTTLAVVRAHHWDIALGTFPRSHRLGSRTLSHPFPRRAALTATFVLLRELGLSN